MLRDARKTGLGQLRRGICGVMDGSCGPLVASTHSLGHIADTSVRVCGYMQVLGRRCSPPKLSGSVKLIAEAALLE